MPRPNQPIRNLISRRLASPPIDTGIQRFGRDAVEDLDHSPLAVGLVASSLTEPRTKHTVEPYELILSDEVNPDEAAQWMGKVVVRDYGMDFAVMHMATTVASNRSTDRAIDELEHGAERGYFGFVFLIERGDLNEAQEERAKQIHENLPRLKLPVMRLLSTEAVETGLEDGIPERQLTIGPEFTVDSRLEYPLILRRTIEPVTELSLVETT